MTAFRPGLRDGNGGVGKLRPAVMLAVLGPVAFCNQREQREQPDREGARKGNCGDHIGRRWRPDSHTVTVPHPPKTGLASVCEFRGNRPAPGRAGDDIEPNTGSVRRARPAGFWRHAGGGRATVVKRAYWLAGQRGTDHDVDP